MLLRSLRVYLLIEESLIIKFALLLILSVNDATAFLSLNMRSLRDNALNFSNKYVSVSLITHMLHHNIIFPNHNKLWFGNMMDIFGYICVD